MKKIIKTTVITDYEVLTDSGFVNIEAIHETVPYQVYLLKLNDGNELKCADNHIVFGSNNFAEIFVKDLSIGDRIYSSNEYNEIKEAIVVDIKNLGYEENMFDLELSDDSNHRYYTNGVLSHNTHLAKQVAIELFGSADAMIRLDMSEYQEKYNLSKLIGTTAGYIGYEEGGILTEKVKNKPYSVILFDEIEKAHKDIFSILLQILDDGHITDGQGRKINFKNTLIILTSNIGVKKTQDFGVGIGFNTNETNHDQMRKDVLLKEMKKYFLPEFLNRIDDTIVFNNLTSDDINKIVRIEMDKLLTRVFHINYNITCDESVIEHISNIGFDPIYGARPLKRMIQETVGDMITDNIMSNFLKQNKKYILKIDNGQIKIVTAKNR